MVKTENKMLLQTIEDIVKLFSYFFLNFTFDQDNAAV